MYENRGEFHVQPVDDKPIDQVRSQIANCALTIQVKREKGTAEVPKRILETGQCLQWLPTQGTMKVRPYSIANSGPTAIRTLRTQKNPGQAIVA